MDRVDLIRIAGDGACRDEERRNVLDNGVEAEHVGHGLVCARRMLRASRRGDKQVQTRLRRLNFPTKPTARLSAGVGHATQTRLGQEDVVDTRKGENAFRSRRVNLSHPRFELSMGGVH